MPQGSFVKIAEIITQFLISHNVHHVFGIPGYANSPFYLSLYENPQVEVILTKHEYGAAWMAYGYAISSNKFGVCTGTSGGAVTNMLSGIAAAYANSIPLLIITGQVETTKFGLGAFQEMTGQGPRSIDILKLMAPLTKENIMMTKAEQWEGILHRIEIALHTGRLGPVHLNIPVDLQMQESQFPALTKFQPPALGNQTKLLQDLQEIQLLLQTAKHPFLLIGRGCQRYQSDVIALANALSIPFGTTLQAKGLVASEKNILDLGVTGIAGSLRCRHYLKNDCDLLISLGASLNEFTTFGFAEWFIQEQKIVQIDIDPAQLFKFKAIHRAFNYDLQSFLPVAAQQLPSSCCEFDFQQFQSYYASIPLESTIPKDKEIEGKLAPGDVIALLECFCPPDTMFFADAGNHAVWAALNLKMKQSQMFVIDINTGCMGSGVNAVIGAKVAHPARAAVCICGDGGFFMNGIEISTAVEYQIPVTWIIFNDQQLGMVAQGFKEKYHRNVDVSYRHSNVANLAKSLGIKTISIYSTQALSMALAELNMLTQPLVFDIHINAAYVPLYGRGVEVKNKQPLRDANQPANSV